MSKKIKVPKAVNGYGYSGIWKSPKDTVGWNTTPYVSGKSDRKYPSSPADTENHGSGERYFLCEITIKPILDKLGRPITKVIPNRKTNNYGK